VNVLYIYSLKIVKIRN